MPGNFPQEYPISFHTGRHESEGVATNLRKIQAGQGGIWYVLVPLDTHLTLKTETKDIHPEVLVEAIPKPELHVGKHQGVTILYLI